MTASCRARVVKGHAHEVLQKKKDKDRQIVMTESAQLRLIQEAHAEHGGSDVDIEALRGPGWREDEDAAWDAKQHDNSLVRRDRENIKGKMEAKNKDFDSE